MSRKLIMQGPARRWLNTAEAALYLGMSAKGLYERVRLRRLPFSRLNGSLRFDIRELDHILERNRVKPTGQAGDTQSRR